MANKLIKLDYALLGLLHQQPMSGYDLRKIFISTPLKHFSDSPGSIYPALDRLERAGWIKGKIDANVALRPKKIFSPTPKGLAQLKVWLKTPITQEDIIWHIDVLMLRLSFMSAFLETAEIIGFLESMATETSVYISSLREYFRSNSPEMPVSGSLALRGGIEAYEDRLRFVRSAIRELKPAK